MPAHVQELRDESARKKRDKERKEFFDAIRQRAESENG